VQGLIRSPLLGPKGNVEFLVNLVYPGEKNAGLAEMIEVVVLPAVVVEGTGE